MTELAETEAENEKFIRSLAGGTLIQINIPHDHWVLLHADRLLQILDEKNRDFSDINGNEFDEIVADHVEELILSRWHIILDRVWFMLLSPRPVDIGNYDDRMFQPSWPRSATCLRLVEVLWEEKRLFLCYSTRNFSLLKEEWVPYEPSKF